MCVCVRLVCVRWSSSVDKAFKIGLTPSVHASAAAMGLISDRKSKKQKEKEKEFEKLRNAQNAAKSAKSPLKKGMGVVGPAGGGPMKYPAGYYTAPASQSSWAHHAHHPAMPRAGPNVNPRYQTWVAPRKQPHLNQLVSLGLKWDSNP